jgi:hypothetical protein
MLLSKFGRIAALQSIPELRPNPVTTQLLSSTAYPKQSTFHHFTLCLAAYKIRKVRVRIASQPCRVAQLLFKTF